MTEHAVEHLYTSGFSGAVTWCGLHHGGKIPADRPAGFLDATGIIRHCPKCERMLLRQRVWHALVQQKGTR